MTAQLTHRAAEPLRKRREPFVDIHRSGRRAIVACVALCIALSGAATGDASVGAPAPRTGAEPAAPACPDTVIPNAPIMPGAVGCWNAIAAQTVRLAAPYNTQGLIYMGYVQAAVYDAISKIEGRYRPYDDFDPPAGIHVAAASPDAATAAAAHTMLTSAFLAFPAPTLAGLPTDYADYIDALGGAAAPAIAAGISIGQASANDLIADLESAFK